MKKIAPLFIMLAMLSFSCQFQSELKEFIALGREIKKEYKCDEAKISLEKGRMLKIIIVNSSYNDSSDDVRQREADKIGQMVAQYSSADKVNGGKVSFSATHNFAVVKVSEDKTYDMHYKK